MSIRQRTNWRTKLLSYGLPFVFLAVLTLFLGSSLSDMAQKTAEESLHSTEEGVRRAAVHCYAIEGQYPESVAYLEENYGLRIDHERYIVHYDIFADNIMPEITVFSLADNAEQ